MVSSPASHVTSQSIGVGVIGMGWMGLVHSRAYRTIADRFHGSGIRARLVICAENTSSARSPLAATVPKRLPLLGWHGRPAF